MRLATRKQRGQNIIEYLLLVTAIAVLLIGVFVKGGKFASTVNGMIDAPRNMVVISNRLLNLVTINSTAAPCVISCSGFFVRTCTTVCP
jgi:Flp pilus assembly pilin Flp